MPRSQTATVPNYEFGRSPTNGDSLRWRAKRGVRLQGKVEAHDAGLTYTFETSPDGTTWSALTVAKQGQVLTDVAVVNNGVSDFSINLRQDIDVFLRMKSTGGRGILQLRGAEWLEELKL